MKKLILLLLILILNHTVKSQSYYFGIKGGPNICFQKWEGYNQGILFSYHIAGFWESYSESNPNNALFAHFGLYNRGSALRNATYFDTNNILRRLSTSKFIFRNLSFGVGAKHKNDINYKMKWFYSFGLRAEYTIGNNLNKYNELNSYFRNYFPVEAYINNFNYGATVSGGIEFKISELVEGLIELSVDPDFSNQYEQPEISGVIDPYHPANTITLPYQRIKNTGLEISLGLRFMRKVEYTD